MKEKIKKITANIVAVAMLMATIPLAIADGATEVSKFTNLNAITTAGEYVLTNDMDITAQYLIKAGITLDGGGYTLKSAMTNLATSVICHQKDAFSSTFKNITFDGDNQAFTDGCLWLGRGAWIWEDVTVKNWATTMSHRGAVTLGKSGSAAGNLTIYNGMISDNNIGIALDKTDTVCTIYGGTVIDNTDSDIHIYSGTVNLLDNDDKTAKIIGKIIMESGSVNIGGNTSIEELAVTSGNVNITDDITSADGIVLSLDAYVDDAVVATITDDVDSIAVLEDIKLPAEQSENYSLEVVGSNIVLKAEVEEPATEISTFTDLNAISTAGKYILTNNIDIDQYSIKANIVLDGGGYTLTSANTALNQASMFNSADGRVATIKNIVLDGGNQQKTDTCLWLGRGKWIWENVTVENWSSTNTQRGAVSVGTSGSDPGNLTIYSGTVKSNSTGITVVKGNAICTIYGGTIIDNTDKDIGIYSGTLNILDNDDKTAKIIGKIIVEGGNVNIGGNTAIEELAITSGSITITDDITSADGIVLSLSEYIDGTVVATIADEVDSATVLEDIKLPTEQCENYSLEVVDSNIVLKAVVEPTAEPTTEPTAEPTEEPTTEPTAEPTAEPTTEPTAEPTAEPTTEPTTEPTVEPTAEPTTEPTAETTTEPTPDVNQYTTKVEVDYDFGEGVSNRLASGVLHAVDYKTPAEYLSDGVYLNAIRGQAHQYEFDNYYTYLPGFFDDKTYERINEINPDNVLMMGLYYGFKPQYGSNWKNAALENDGETWKSYIKTFMQEAYDTNGNKVKKVYSWIPWNEPELQWGSSNLSNFYIAFEYAYDAVKEFDPRELVQGPEFASYNLSRMTSFLTYCRDNDCLPDVLSWHELKATPLDIEAHTKELRDWMLANDIEPMPMAVTEYQGTGYGKTDSERTAQGTYNPGLTVAYLATMERAEEYGFKYGLKSAWGRTGEDPLFTTDLGQMADFETGTMPTGLWHVYHEYKNMTGEKVSATADTSIIDAFATYDSSADRKTSTILIGNWENDTEYISVTLNNIPNSLVVNNKVNVKVDSISETLATALYETDVLNDKEYDVTDGSATVNVILEGRAAAALTITPPVDEEAKTELALDNKTATSNITISETDDVIYATGGKTSTYTNENPIGNEQSTSYKDNGDSITFTVNVSADSIYRIDGTHITGTDMGFMQLYIDGKAFSEPIDLYDTAENEETLNYGNLFLSAGEHEFTYQIVGFGKNENSTDTKLSFKSIALTPVEKPENECVVTFDLNAADAKATQSTSVVQAGDKIDFIPQAERENYKIVAWNTQEDGNGDNVTADTVVNFDMTVYAVWEKDVRVEMIGDTDYAVLTRNGDTATITIEGATDKIVRIQANTKDVTALLVNRDNNIILENYDVSDATVFIVDVTTVESVKTTTIEGSRLILPSSVIALADDGTIAERNVTWDYSTLTKTGTKHIDTVIGTFDGGSVEAEVTVLPCSEELADMVSSVQYATPHNMANKYTEKFTVEFDLSFEAFSATNTKTCSFISFINSEATDFGWGKYGPQIIVEGDGSIKARNGDGNGNLVSLSTATRQLELNEIYKLRVDIDPVNDTYNVWIVYPDGVEEQFGTDAHFRRNLTDIGKVAVEDSDNVNQFKVANFKISTFTDADISTETQTPVPIEGIVYNETENIIVTSLSGCLIICNYNEAGVLTEISVSDVQSDIPTVPSIIITDMTRIYLWDSIEGMKPLTTPWHK